MFHERPRRPWYLHTVRLLAALVILLTALPAAADPAGDQAASATMTALRDALARGDVDAVVAAMGSKVTIARVALDGSCAKRFPIKKRTVRGSSRARFVRCWIGSWQAPDAEPPLVARAGGWDVDVAGITFRLVVASGGKVVVAGITGDAGDVPAMPRVAILTDSNRKVLDRIIDKNLDTSLGKFRGGTGKGTGTGTGVGGGGQAEGDFVSSGRIEGGRDGDGPDVVPSGSGSRPRQVTVATGTPVGDLGGLTADEIDRVMRSRAGVFRACYQKELNRTRGLSGKIVVELAIGPDGAVTSARIKSTTMKNEAVELCLRSNVMRLRFPAKGVKAVVVYPLVFDNSP